MFYWQVMYKFTNSAAGRDVLYRSSGLAMDATQVAATRGRKSESAKDEGKCVCASAYAYG